RKIVVGTKGIPHLVTHDARTIRYPDSLIKVNDTIQIDLETGRSLISSSLTLREAPGSFDVVHMKDANGNSFATRLSN
ncbi:40S ribosomal protein S4, X isoform, partial [Saguinus oedipus]